MTARRTALTLLPLAAALLLAACSSDNIGHGWSGDARYGTGPDKTKPYPQSEPVDIRGVGGSAIRYEHPTKRGNREYNVFGRHYQVWNGCDSYIETGVASWYGPGFNGRSTSNGEIYNQKGYSAAHKNLPLPSYLKVTNLNNGKAVIVRVNDRGPFHGSRIIDLSEGAARHINMVGAGTAKVKIEYLKVGPGGEVLNASGAAHRASAAVAAAP
ncbi:MAG: septal ring lytic transglycosylase RlpA family protein, partial [Succinivibrionaceae bacterium]|nr:septal ring lytic transglycosylase RlpA family protein [Succinivibrionaceae bacterium]